MSSRIVPLAALSVVLLVIFWAVVATAQQPGATPAVPGAAATAGGAVQPPPGAAAGEPTGLQNLPLPPAQAPFQLSPEEQQSIDRVLLDWQTVSARVQTLEAKFTRWDYDGVFGNGNTPKRVVPGDLRYAAPDKGYYELEDKSEKWICTGTAIFEFRTDLKQVREYRIPPQLQGQAISDGPMPFVFGVDKEKMKARYWVRVSTPPDRPGEVWLEAYPRTAKDAANFKKVDVILKFTLNADGTLADLKPYGLNMHLPNGKDRTVYRFDELKVNGVGAAIQNFINIFVRPTTPLGWQHQVVDDGGGPGGPEAPQPGNVPGAGVGGAPTTTVPR